MRTIKCRGKCTSDSQYAGEWVTGGVVICEKSNDVLIISAITDKVTCTYHVKHETVGQFTGLHDDNDSEIYEGDIIHIAGRGFKEYDFGVVTWHKNGYFFVDDSFGKYEKSNVNPIGDFFDRSKHDFNGIVITVNGNIHDNPEILKKEE